jgi:hypothetical protein
MNQNNIDFFDNKYKKENARKEILFGIIDDTRLAYTTTDGEERCWCAVVHNDVQSELTFTPVDHNIIVLDNNNLVSMCDGMLHCDASIAFIELKVEREQWAAKAINQLRSTIKIFSSNHNVDAFKKRYAYVSNKKHPTFQYSMKSRMQQFYKETKFRLCIQRDIVIK